MPQPCISASGQGQAQGSRGVAWAGRSRHDDCQTNAERLADDSLSRIGARRPCLAEIV